MEDSEWDFTWANRISHKAWSKPVKIESLHTPMLDDIQEDDIGCWGKIKRKRGAAKYFKLRPC